MSDIQALYDQKRDLIAQETQLKNKFQNDEISGSEMKSEFEKIEEKLQGVESSISIAEKEEAAAKSKAEPKEPTDSRSSQDIYYNEVFPKLLQNKMNANELTDQERKVFQDVHARADLGTSSGGGSNLVPTELQDEIIRAQLYMGGIREAALVRTTQTGNTMEFAFSDSTSESAEQIDENPSSSTTQKNPSYSQKKLESFTFSGKEILVSEQLLNDSPFDLIEDFRRIWSQRFFNKMNDVFTNGSGSSEPEGIVTGANNAGNTTLTGSNSAIARTDFIKVFYDVPRAYRNNMAFQVSDNLLKNVRELEVGSSDSRPLYQPSANAGEPDRIEGVPFVVNNDLDTINTASGNILTAGDHQAFYIRDIQDATMKRLNELYAEKNQVAFLMFMRHDSKLVDPNAIRVLQMAT